MSCNSGHSFLRYHRLPLRQLRHPHHSHTPSRHRDSNASCMSLLVACCSIQTGFACLAFIAVWFGMSFVDETAIVTVRLLYAFLDSPPDFCKVQKAVEEAVLLGDLDATSLRLSDFLACLHDEPICSEANKEGATACNILLLIDEVSKVPRYNSDHSNSIDLVNRCMTKHVCIMWTSLAIGPFSRHATMRGVLSALSISLLSH